MLNDKQVHRKDKLININMKYLYTSYNTSRMHTLPNLNNSSIVLGIVNSIKIIKYNKKKIMAEDCWWNPEKIKELGQFYTSRSEHKHLCLLRINEY